MRTSHPEVDLHVAVERVVVDIQRQGELDAFPDVWSLQESQTVGVQLPPHCGEARGGETFNREVNAHLIFLSETRTRWVQTSGRLQQDPQLCRDHQVRDVNHLPLAQLLTERKNSYRVLRRWTVPFFSLETEQKNQKTTTNQITYNLSAPPLLRRPPLGFQLHLRTHERSPHSATKDSGKKKLLAAHPP